MHSRAIRMMILLMMLSVNLLMWGCDMSSTGNKTLGTMAYNGMQKDERDYTVYLKELDEYVPYLVIGNDYNGNCILIRKYLLDERMPFNPKGRFTAYYENSAVDQFLNHEFIERLAPSVALKIIDSDLLITDENALGVTGTDTVMIRRKIFLLGYSEVMKISSEVAAHEGSFIPYFENHSINGTDQLGEPGSSWTRTAYTWHDNAVWSIGFDGSIGDALVQVDNGVRPALCLDRGVEVIAAKGIIDQQTVYTVVDN